MQENIVFNEEKRIKILMNNCGTECREEFISRLCSSLAASISQYSPSDVEFYGASLETLSLVQRKTYSFFIGGPAFSFRESRDFPQTKKGRYYINVGEFMDLYEKKRKEGERVEFYCSSLVNSSAFLPIIFLSSSSLAENILLRVLK